MKMKQYEDLFCYLPSLSLDSSGIVTFANETFFEYLKIDEKEILQKEVTAFIEFCKNKREAKKKLIEAKRELRIKKKWRGEVAIPSLEKEHIGIVVCAISDMNENIKEYAIVFHPEAIKKAFNFKPTKEDENDEIIEGLARDDFLLYFQPIFSNRTKKIVKYEALLRKKEGKRILTPDSFLKKMKRMESFNLLTLHVIEKIISYITLYRVPLSINLSISDIKKHQVFLINILKKNPLVPSLLTIEILEDENMSDDKMGDTNSFYDFLHLIKGYGVSLAIDDFGVKHSNWNRFLEFEPDILKIDGSLIKDIDNNKYMRDIVSSLVDFAKKHNISTVAEYVENKTILNIIEELGVDYSQGYFLGKPESMEKTFSAH